MHRVVFTTPHPFTSHFSPHGCQRRAGDGVWEGTRYRQSGAGRRQLRSCVAAENRQSAPRGVQVPLASLPPPPIPLNHVALLLFTSWILTSLPHQQAVTSPSKLHYDPPSSFTQTPLYLITSKSKVNPLFLLHALHPPTNHHTSLSTSSQSPNSPHPPPTCQCH